MSRYTVASPSTLPATHTHTHTHTLPDVSRPLLLLREGFKGLMHACCQTALTYHEVRFPWSSTLYFQVI